MARLSGKTALITGAGSGIGAATATLLAAQGAKVVAVGRHLETVQRVADQIKAAGGEALAVTADVSDEAQIAAMFRRALDTFGRIDVLHNNAALTDPAIMAADGAIANMDAAVWDRVMTVNLRGPMLCCKHAIPHMLQQGGGSIIMTGSGKGIHGDLGQPAYGASKAALINLTQNVATQYGKQGIRANILIVGLVATESLLKSLSAPARAMMESHHLTPSIGEPRHIADAVAFLASDESAFVTGHSLYVDGGVTAHSAAVADIRRAMAATQRP
jgi:NAD(P)-dependent dehydrogenase (short-subunit alcohol dehydrogenase family)